MLHIYTDESLVPKDIQVIFENDAYFMFISRKIENNSETVRLLRDIEGAQYQSTATFTGKFIPGAGLYYDCLSTGCKTALNILYNPDKCFDLLECGVNAVDSIIEIKEGYCVLDNLVAITNFNEVDCIVNDKFVAKNKKDLGAIYERLEK